MSGQVTDERIGNVEVRLLCAYIDRELDEQSRAEVEDLLRLDSEALHYVIQAKKLNALTRMALDADLNQPEARAAQKKLDDQLRSYQKEFTVSKKQAWSRVSNYPYFAMAATIMLLFIGYQTGSLSLDFEVQKQLIALEKEKNILLAAVEGERNRVLEYIPSGQTEKWKSDNGFLQAELMPIRTLRTENNQYCREYKEVVMQQEKVESRHAVSCRVGKETWRVKMILLNGESKTM